MLKELMTLKSYVVMISEAKARRDDLWARVQETPEYQNWEIMSGAHDALRATRKGLEVAVKVKAVAIYERATRMFGCADKKKWPGLTIKEFRVVQVRPGANPLGWARAKAPVLVKEVLDTKGFDAMVKAGTVPDGVAIVIVEPRAQLSRSK